MTNDIYTTEDAQFLRATGVLAAERIVAVQTGCCPHTAIRDDITINLEAVEELERDQGPLELVLVESGGDNLTAVFSPALADVQIFVIDVAGGDDIPRKGGPGIARADLLVINKTDLAPYVGSDVERMLSDAAERRGELPVHALSLVAPPHAQPVAAWIRAPARRVRRRWRAPALQRERRPRPAPRPSPRACPPLARRGRSSLPSRAPLARRGRPSRPPPASVARRPRSPSSPSSARRPATRSPSCAAATRLAPRILARGAVVRAAFVPTQAGPLAGDRDSARIVVGAGATLVLEPVAATLALPGAARTVLRLDVTVRERGRLVLDEGPLIVAAGAEVERRCVIELETGAVAALRETIVLGRDGEAPGTLDATLRATLAGRPLLHDGLRFEAAGRRRPRRARPRPSRAEQRVPAGDAPAGAEPDAAPAKGPEGTRDRSRARDIEPPPLAGPRKASRARAAEPLQLAGPGALLRVTATTAAQADARIAPTWHAWSQAVLALEREAAPRPSGHAGFVSPNV